MEIVLRKVGKTPFLFEKNLDNLKIKGFLQFDSGKLLKLEAKLSGFVNCTCDRCGKEFTKDVDEELDLFVSDGMLQDKDSSYIDVVEAFDGKFNLDDFIRSEEQLIKDGYNYCMECVDSDFEYEI